MSDRNINDLRPEFLALVQKWETDMASAGIDYIITCTLRTAAEQTALYAQGRTAPGPIVTYAQAGESAHGYGCAIDFVVMVNGKPDWSGNSPPWNEAIKLGQQAGMVSLRPMESAHLEHPDWKQLSKANA
jgi:peptidoglycan LD-endopeptidase CwlK